MANQLRSIFRLLKQSEKTSLMGKVCHDCTVVPARTGLKHGESLMKHQNMTQGKERPKVTLLNEILGSFNLMVRQLKEMPPLYS